MRNAPLVLAFVVALALISSLWLTTSAKLPEKIEGKLSMRNTDDRSEIASIRLPYLPGETISDPKPNKPAIS